MTHYDTGRRFEYAVRDDLRANGYDVIRSAGSKSGVDIVAFKDRVRLDDDHSLLFVQAKRSNGTIPPAERAELIRLANMALAVPLVAYRSKPRGPIAYRQLTGPGPKDWQPWTADWAVTA